MRTEPDGGARPFRPGQWAPPVHESRPSGWQIVAVVLGLATMGWFGVLWLATAKPVGVALIEIPIFLLLTAPLFVLAARGEHRFDLAGLLATGLILRFAASYYRFTHAADAATYHNAGVELAKGYRGLDFGVPVDGAVPGTGGMKIIAGVAEVFTNSNSFATFLLFTWLGFVGCYLLYRAFVTALPDGDHHRYALLIFLWPTLVFWPSSIGKDCWMLFTIGIAALGAARVLARRPGGYSLLVVGSLLGSFVRPHVSLLLLVAFGAALLVGRRRVRPGSSSAGTIGKVAGLALLLVLGAVLATRTAELLNTNDVTGSVTIGLEQNAGRTAQGGSAFVPADPQNPIGYAKAAVTVVFRPFLFEAHGSEVIATSLEAMFLALLTLASWKRLVAIPRRLRTDPYLAMALGYTLMFIFAFGTISNFGILARERSQLMPFLFVLLSVPAATATTVSWRKRREEEATPPPAPSVRYRAPGR